MTSQQPPMGVLQRRVPSMVDLSERKVSLYKYVCCGITRREKTGGGAGEGCEGQVSLHTHACCGVTHRDETGGAGVCVRACVCACERQVCLHKHRLRCLLRPLELGFRPDPDPNPKPDPDPHPNPSLRVCTWMLLRMPPMALLGQPYPDPSPWP